MHSSADVNEKLIFESGGHCKGLIHRPDLESPRSFARKMLTEAGMKERWDRIDLIYGVG